MFFNCKVAGGALALVGLGSFSYFWFSKQCSLEQTSYFYKNSLDVNESVLDCQGEDRDYSVFLVFKENSGSNKQDELSFQVVDNKDGGKVKWGPGSKSEEAWTDWGIAIFKETTTTETFGTEIRVPKTGRVYDKKKHWTSLVIPCQKSHLQLKPLNCSNGGGNVLRSANMKFEIQQDGVKITKNFDWKDSFKPKRIFCSR